MAAAGCSTLASYARMGDEELQNTEPRMTGPEDLEVAPLAGSQ
jgi:hypothetical protein